MPTPITIAKNDTLSLDMLSNLVNRHGCITGATGTGKTVTLQKIAQSLSEIGVPVFMADVKGDLSGIAKAGALSEKMGARLSALKLETPQWAGCPVTFWDVFGEKGHPVRATVSDLGPLLLARMLNLNDTQEGVLQLVFRIADDNGLLLLDSKDLRAMLQHVGDNAADFKTSYGNISAASIGAIQRGLIAIEEQGGDQFFGEPMLNIDDLLQTDARGKGLINILAADKLMNAPRLYAVFLLWMLSELFENLPEVGDLDKPKLVFFFDEAHLLFTDAPKALLQKIEQVVRLIRSKGVGVFFVTQNPIDIPDTVLGQLGNRVQHALRAYTPRDQKAVKAAAETFRPNPALDVSQVITELGVGEALVSFLDEKGAPRMVERVFILPPASQLGPLDAAERKAAIDGSIVAGVYEKTVDRESAYEKLNGRVAAGARSAQDAPDGRATSPAQQPPGQPRQQPQEAAGGSMFGDVLGGLFGQTGKRDTAVQAMVKSAVRSIGSQVGREIIRGVLGSIMKKR
ncbi:helicase HerA-like C-terminal domain-containing protein [Burkholderia sp. LMU1-1-1.1]|uniref:helicase HerA-like C-terminal domain-containing protein n=1 Tax=Burkholderia sp. LMU1-1-1.1 TaxID=3135266 RepID=UPI00341D9321